jgi:3-hydroxymyristoyl/3-hydroxydecanoyl-(acyl carrier protein) dehydratase
LGPNNVNIELKNHAAMPGDMLRMIDRVTFLAPGRVRTEKDVNLDEWFFKAHFFQDPVQPGSLGLEAMLQAMQFLAVHEQHTQGMRKPRFESIAVGAPLNWKYRGQVIPKNKLIQVEIENAQVREPGLIVADGSLSVDGLKVYSASGMGLRIVDDDP